MSVINNFCITHKNYKFLNSLEINVIVGGSTNREIENFPNNWIRDNVGDNISQKNKSFGTLTSHYWVWKNKLKYFDENEWIGFSHYRRHWIKKNNQKEISLLNLGSNLLKRVPEDSNYDVILPEKIYLKNLKISKLIKKGFRNIIKNPSILFNRGYYSVGLHFDLFHGYGIIDKAADLLNHEEKNDFKQYFKEKSSFHQFEMFISKKKNIIHLYEKTFNWIFECEKLFSKIKLEGYGKERLFNFLAERFFSFYFEKYTKIKTWPYVFLDNNLLKNDSNK